MGFLASPLPSARRQLVIGCKLGDAVDSTNIYSVHSVMVSSQNLALLFGRVEEKSLMGLGKLAHVSQTPRIASSGGVVPTGGIAANSLVVLLRSVEVSSPGVWGQRPHGSVETVLCVDASSSRGYRQCSPGTGLCQILKDISA